ncbi:MAG: DUF2971 domain-containing protein, partial [bacterium]|nr:DUF2971 domain-containing protein [bacterium]
MKLYKYRCVDDYTLSAIRDSTIWFSSPLDLNDPYDCQLSMNPFGTKEEWRAFLTNTLPVGENTHVSKEELIRHYIDDRQIHNDPDYAKKLFQRIFDEMRSKIGVCCFSRVWDSIPMWSHYADGHKGVCVEYDSERDKNLANLFMVNYCNEYPTVGVHDTKETISSRFLTSKASAWGYEEEYRLVAGKGPLKVERRSLTGVIFGCSCPP